MCARDRVRAASPPHSVLHIIHRTERTHDAGSWRAPATPWFRSDGAAGCVVGHTSRGVHRSRLVRRIYDLGGVAGRSLPLGALPLAAVLTGVVRRSGARAVRWPPRCVAGVAAVLACTADSVGTRTVPLHLL